MRSTFHGESYTLNGNRLFILVHGKRHVVHFKEYVVLVHGHGGHDHCNKKREIKG
jgi:hypothetical protein